MASLIAFLVGSDDVCRCVLPAITSGLQVFSSGYQLPGSGWDDSEMTGCQVRIGTGGHWQTTVEAQTTLACLSIKAKLDKRFHEDSGEQAHAMRKCDQPTKVVWADGLPGAG